MILFRSGVVHSLKKSTRKVVLISFWPQFLISLNNQSKEEAFRCFVETFHVTEFRASIFRTISESLFYHHVHGSLKGAIVACSVLWPELEIVLPLSQKQVFDSEYFMEITDSHYEIRADFTRNLICFRGNICRRDHW